MLLLYLNIYLYVFKISKYTQQTPNCRCISPLVRFRLSWLLSHPVTQSPSSYVPGSINSLHWDPTLGNPGILIMAISQHIPSIFQKFLVFPLAMAFFTIHHFSQQKTLDTSKKRITTKNNTWCIQQQKNPASTNMWLLFLHLSCTQAIRCRCWWTMLCSSRSTELCWTKVASILGEDKQNTWDALLYMVSKKHISYIYIHDMCEVIYIYNIAIHIYIQLWCISSRWYICKQQVATSRNQHQWAAVEDPINKNINELVILPPPCTRVGPGPNQL